MLDDTSTAYIAALTRGDRDSADRCAAILDTVTILEQNRRNRADRLADTAHEYAAAGVAVFPIEPSGKRPLTKHGFKDATTDPGQVTAWWTQWPDANIGLPTGHLFDVIDVDGSEGVAAMWGGAECVADSLTILGHAHTARNGGHHLYVPVRGHGNKTAIRPGVDYRGAGGYVVAPPSVGATGRRYEWAIPLTLTSTGKAASA